MGFAMHDHSETKLSCVDCNEAICPKCMVQCPVGFRCPECSDKFSSHVLKIDKSTFAKAILSSAFIGFVYGYLGATNHSIGMATVIGYFAGLFTGKLIHRIIGYKIGTKIVLVIGLSTLGGILFSPLRETVSSLISLSFMPPDPALEEFGSATFFMAAGTLINTLIFIAGVLTPLYMRK